MVKVLFYDPQSTTLVAACSPNMASNRYPENSKNRSLPKIENSYPRKILHTYAFQKILEHMITISTHAYECRKEVDNSFRYNFLLQHLIS